MELPWALVKLEAVTKRGDPSPFLAKLCLFLLLLAPSTCVGMAGRLAGGSLLVWQLSFSLLVVKFLSD